MKLLLLLFVILIIKYVECSTTATKGGTPIISPPDWWKERIEQSNLIGIENTTEPNSYLMTSVGNGYVSFVIGGESIYVGGVFNGPALATGLLNNLPSHRASIPNFQNITIGGGAQLQYAGLDIENATYTRVYSYDNQPEVIVTQVFYAHQKIRNILVQEIIIDNTENNNDFQLILSTDFGVNMVNSTDFKILNISNTFGEDNKFQVYNLTILVPEIDFFTSVSVTTTTVPSSLNIKSNELKKYYFITSFYTNLESKDYIEASIDIYKTSYLLSDALLDVHKDEWKKIWKDGGAEIEGDQHLAAVVNSSMYYILSSIRDDWAFSISPGSLSSNGYNGHSFWDSETWMSYPMLVFYPKLVRDCILQYRINNLATAHEKAKSYRSDNYTGYMFPWESAFTGTEVCPLDAPTGILEQHITSDIALTMRQYFYLTNDIDWLIDYGYKAVKGMAQFWESRVEFNATSGQYSINVVIPPDEYAVGVNNSVYTNVAAKMTFEWAIEAAAIVGDTSNIPITLWQSIADNLVVLFDEENQIHPEYQGYNGKIIKQADVVLLGYPLMYNMSSQVRENDLRYYQNVTDPAGPAMTYSMYALAWLELGNLEEAERNWYRAYNNCNNSPFLVWTETPTGGTTNFITGVGGFLQGLINGYGGLRVYQNNLDFFPQLPPTVTSLKIRSIDYVGSTFSVFWNTSIIQFEMVTIDPKIQLTFISSSLPNNIILNSNDPIILPIGNKFQIFVK